MTIRTDIDPQYAPGLQPPEHVRHTHVPGDCAIQLSFGAAFMHTYVQYGGKHPLPFDTADGLQQHFAPVRYCSTPIEYFCF